LELEKQTTKSKTKKEFKQMGEISMTGETGRCFKCKKVVVIKNPQIGVFGQVKGIKGVCPECGTKVFHMLGRIKKK